MKKVLTLTLLTALGTVCFISCKKDYTCYCDVITEVDNKQVDSQQRSYIIHDNKDDAEAQCKFYLKDTTHLGRKALEYNKCAIQED